MKSFEEIVKEANVGEKSLNEYIKLNESDFSYMNESERDEVQEILRKFGDKKINELDEGILGSILGGLTGFVVGPAIGKVIANSLGIDKGIIYDMLTSRLVAAALGSAITKYVGSSK
jgi:uncharacterized membrane protein YeaQ/YmgE (transglycosylase-associated protein family)